MSSTARSNCSDVEEEAVLLPGRGSKRGGGPVFIGRISLGCGAWGAEDRMTRTKAVKI
jgi:hypothetical protein